MIDDSTITAIFKLQHELNYVKRTQRESRSIKKRASLQKRIKALQATLAAKIDEATAPRDGLTRWWLRSSLEKQLKAHRKRRQQHRQEKKKDSLRKR